MRPLSQLLSYAGGRGGVNLFQEQNDETITRESSLYALEEAGLLAPACCKFAVRFHTSSCCVNNKHTAKMRSNSILMPQWLLVWFKMRLTNKRPRQIYHS